MKKEYNTTIDLGIGTPEGFRLLAEQKLELIKLVHNGAPDILNGLISFIDHIQDTCADENDIPEHIVFPHRLQDKNGILLKVGDNVKVDPPTNYDKSQYPNWTTEFNATVIEIKSIGREIFIVVQNMDCDTFDVEPEKITKL